MVILAFARNAQSVLWSLSVFTRRYLHIAD